MAKMAMPQSKHHDHDHEHEHGGDHGNELENDNGNLSHIEIEERRFRGGLPPTPELYALARERWNQLPGSVVRSPMDPVVSNPPVDPETKLTVSDEDENQEVSR